MLNKKWFLITGPKWFLGRKGKGALSRSNIQIKKNKTAIQKNFTKMSLIDTFMHTIIFFQVTKCVKMCQKCVKMCQKVLATKFARCNCLSIKRNIVVKNKSHQREITCILVGLITIARLDARLSSTKAYPLESGEMSKKYRAMLSPSGMERKHAN